MSLNRRVPPNQNVTTTFPVLHHGEVPVYDNLDEWTFHVFGEVEKEVIFTYEEIMRLPQTRLHNDIHCITGWTKLDNQWDGILVTDLMKHVKLTGKACFVMLHCEGDWSTNITLDDFLKPENQLATHHQGAPLTPEHGWPLRMVIPHLYFWKSAKWLRGIQFMPDNRPGFWEKDTIYDPEARIVWEDKSELKRSE